MYNPSIDWQPDPSIVLRNKNYRECTYSRRYFLKNRNLIIIMSCIFQPFALSCYLRLLCNNLATMWKSLSSCIVRMEFPNLHDFFLFWRNNMQCCLLMWKVWSTRRYKRLEMLWNNKQWAFAYLCSDEWAAFLFINDEFPISYASNYFLTLENNIRLWISLRIIISTGIRWGHLQL